VHISAGGLKPNEIIPIVFLRRENGANGKVQLL